MQQNKYHIELRFVCQPDVSEYSIWALHMQQ